MNPHESDELQQAKADQQTDLSHKAQRSRQQQRNLVIGIGVVVLLLLLIVVAVWKWRKPSETAEESVTPLVSVRVAKAEREEIAAPVSAVGTISPREQATVATKVSAQIKKMALLKNKIVKGRRGHRRAGIARPGGPAQ
jgi:multidrug efflux pump subunit AcrA (membrane-fusion protein)